MVYLYIWMFAQIILEMLPISSSGHLLLLQTFFKRYASFDIRTFFAKNNLDYQTIYYLLHMPTLFAVIFYFGKAWLSYLVTDGAICPGPIIWIVITSIIACFFYLVVPRITFPISLGFIITIICLFSTAWCVGSASILDWNLIHAVILGCAQSIAFLPGISRLACTTAVACWLGFSVWDGFCLSWFIQTPLMVAASAKSLLKLYSGPGNRQILNLPTCLVMLIGSGASIVLLFLMGAMIHANLFYLWGGYMFIPLLLWMWMHK